MNVERRWIDRIVLILKKLGIQHHTLDPQALSNRGASRRAAVRCCPHKKKRATRRARKTSSTAISREYLKLPVTVMCMCVRARARVCVNWLLA